MDYVAYISTPMNTAKEAPLITTVTLSRGRLSGGFLFFPRGPSGYLHFVARIGTHQIIPYNIDQSYRLNGCVIPLHIDIDFFQPPFLIHCLTWNTSTTYDHALTVGFFLDQWKSPRKTKTIARSLINATKGYLTGGERRL